MVAVIVSNNNYLISC